MIMYEATSEHLSASCRVWAADELHAKSLAEQSFIDAGHDPHIDPVKLSIIGRDGTTAEFATTCRTR